MKAAEGVAEELKEQNQLEWVKRTGNIQQRVNEIISSELIYDNQCNYNTTAEDFSPTVVNLLSFINSELLRIHIRDLF